MGLVPGIDTTVKGFSMEPASVCRGRAPVIDWSFDYFASKTQGNRLPSRRDLNPIELPSILPEVAILQPLYTDDCKLVDAKVLLLGTDLDRFYGAFTGKNISEHPNHEVFDRTMQAGQYAIQIREPIFVNTVTLSVSKTQITVAALYVPMSEDGITIDRLFVHNHMIHKDRVGG
jgi:hypothetical protein